MIQLQSCLRRLTTWLWMLTKLLLNREMFTLARGRWRNHFWSIKVLQKRFQTVIESFSKHFATFRKDSVLFLFVERSVKRSTKHLFSFHKKIVLRKRSVNVILSPTVAKGFHL